MMTRAMSRTLDGPNHATRAYASRLPRRTQVHHPAGCVAPPLMGAADSVAEALCTPVRTGQDDSWRATVQGDHRDLV